MPDGLFERGIAIAVDHAELGPRRLGFGHEAPGSAPIGGHAAFDENVHAHGKTHVAVISMCGGWRADDQRISLNLRKRTGKAGEKRNAFTAQFTETVLRHLGGSGIDINDRNGIELGIFSKDVDSPLTNVTCADKNHAKYHGLNLPSRWRDGTGGESLAVPEVTPLSRIPHTGS